MSIGKARALNEVTCLEWIRLRTEWLFLMQKCQTLLADSGRLRLRKNEAGYFETSLSLEQAFEEYGEVMCQYLRMAESGHSSTEENLLSCLPRSIRIQ